jgi:GTP pyrophosphokinase
MHAQPDFRPLAAKLTHLSAGDIADIKRAFEFAVEAHAPQKREDGSPYVLHPIAVAEIVAMWKADRDTVIAALLHDVLEDTPAKKDEIIEKFGRRAALLVEGITKFTQADLSPDLPLDRKVETLRKLFDVMRLDLRSILIKLADRLHNVETIGSLPTASRRRKFAIETLSVYYKIAFHLGMRKVRMAFAEHCVPHAYDNGAEEKKKRDELCKAALHIAPAIEKELIKQHEGSRLLEVSLHPKNLYAFHQFIAEQGATLPQDAYSIIIVVRTEDDCYRLLKTLHTSYRPVSGHFRDFIAAPTEAGYQSLHTRVSMNDGAIADIRIRTPDMQQQIDYGVAITLFTQGEDALPRFSWLKRSASLDLKTRESSSAFWEALESDILRESISVVVDRKRISLPFGSTALDAAYGFYDEKAGNTVSLSVNGRQVNGSEVLKEDDEVHVTFDAKKHVAFDWLKMVSTRHAHLLIVEVLKQTSKSEKIALGATLLQKELDHYRKVLVSDFSKAQRQSAADHFKRESFDQVLSMIGEGVIRARDVVFFLYPDHKKKSSAALSKRYVFRLHLTASQHSGQDILSQLNGVIQSVDIAVDNVNMHTSADARTADIFISGTSVDRLQFADFIALLERQEWTNNVQTLIPGRQKVFLLGAFCTAFAVILLDIFLFPAYQQFMSSLSAVPLFIVQALPLIPILLVNYYLLQLLRHYVVRMRTDRWYLGVALLLNVIGLMLMVLRILLIHEVQFSLLPLIIIFALSLSYVAYAFFQTEALFAPLDAKSTRSVSAKQWSSITARKRVGYIIRLLAVLVWGLEPIYIRYTAVNDLSPFLRTFLLGIGAVVPAGLIYVFRSIIRERKLPSLHLPYDSSFILLLIGQVGYMYFKNASLMYTSGTNLLLFNNFAPLIGLVIAAFFWRRDIAYFKQPSTMLTIFLLAVFAGAGSSLLVYNNALISDSWSIVGDALAMVSTFFDVLMTIGQIQYIKNFQKTDGMLLNLHIFFFLLMCTAPVIALSPLFGITLLRGLTMRTLLLGMGIGLFVGFGQFLNYEAFKRIDGYLAYMMFNLSILVTFILEAFVIHSIEPTMLLVLSGALIIGASVTAEVVNSRCQKKGL